MRPMSRCRVEGRQRPLRTSCCCCCCPGKPGPGEPRTELPLGTAGLPRARRGGCLLLLLMLLMLGHGHGEPGARGVPAVRQERRPLTA